MPRQKEQVLVDTRGASILYALMFMLVAMMVSMTLLSAAVTTAHRVHDDKDWKQERLVLDSAGGVVRGMLKETRFTIRTTTDRVANLRDVVIVSQDGPLADAIGVTILDVANSDAVMPVHPQPITISVDGFPDVVMTYEVLLDDIDVTPGASNDSDRYRIVAMLQVDGGKQRLMLDAYQSNVADAVISDADGILTITEEVSWDDVTLGTHDPDERR